MKTQQNQPEKTDRRKGSGKWTPERLEARRKAKAEREERWRLSREGHAAKQVYQTFMAQPQWMTFVSKESFIRFLKNAIESERSMFEYLNEQSDRSDYLYRENKKHEDIAAAAKYSAAAYFRLEAIHTAEALLRLFEGKDFLYQAPNMVHANFSTYCRSN